MLVTNLFKSRRKRNYNVRKSIVDDRKNLGNPYRNNLLKNSLSSYIFRNVYMNDFVIFIQQVLSDLVDTVGTLKAYKSYTVKKDDSRVR
jgi:hypothetical protein